MDSPQLYQDPRFFGAEWNHGPTASVSVSIFYDLNLADHLGFFLEKIEVSHASWFVKGKQVLHIYV